ncbi:MAG: MipA/OmpV family protein [Gammaproteobacteria bacterium]|nr:MipA/OmpV family protein [Gammaproteobacteria bacterium]
MWRRSIFNVYFILCCTAVAPNNVIADNAEWELGVGIAVLDIPFYPGSSQSKTYAIPIPHFLYRSERLNIDNGIDATLFRASKIKFNLSADFAVPVNSKDSERRQGMPDLDPVIQIGPSLELTLSGGRFKPSHFRLELPVRIAIATDLSSIETIGWTFEPRLTYETRRPYKTGFAYLVSGGLRFSTAELHQYYYNVAPAFATLTRPQFDSAGGYSGLFVDYIANWRTKNIIFFTLLRYQNIGSSAFENSPLVEQNNYLIFGIGASWIFAKSL